MKKQVTIKQAIEMAADCARQGDNDKAERLYRQVLRIQPDNTEAQQALAVLHVARNESGFSSDMNQLLKRYENGQFDETVAEAERLAGLYPDQPMPHNVKGAVLLGQGAVTEAIACIETAIELAPGYADAWSNLGNAQLEAGRDREAVESFRKALELDQTAGLVASANRGLGKALAAQGKFSEARTAFEKVLSRQPADAVTRTALGMALRERGLIKASIDELEKAVKYDPRSSLAHIELGISLGRLSRHKEGLQALQRGVELDPGNSTAHLQLGRFHQRMGNSQLGAKSLRRSLELDPDSAEARHFLNALEGTRTELAPADYVEKHFDGYSSSFDQQLVGTLQYRGHEVLAGMINDYSEDKFSSVADLGCGTGLMGEELKGKADYLLGVDLSSKMLEKAGDRGIYDELAHGEIIQLLSQSDQSFDLLVSADVLVYLGDLQPLMQAVVARSRPGALLAISTELYPEPNGYKLLETGRFAHGKDYVTGVAVAAGLKLERFESGRLRKESGDWLTGGFYLFVKPQ